ncbi:MAG TPA: 3-oxoacyl-[acyl-carrier-protein] synthase III C-terminal domain-containing protein [Dongiaceae bacterium]|nr:3-oxoacyl-[acyl-carrier-protein] synthase III C-terminal domain-containing protein [Dongiaceae bacterium]
MKTSAPAPPPARIASVGTALPPHYADQETLIATLRTFWTDHGRQADRMETLHRNVQVRGRHLALPLEEYARLDGFAAANDAWIRVGLEVGGAAIEAALARAGLVPRDVDALWVTSVTGVAAPSLDARLINRLGFRNDLKRVPIFGLGCVAGAAGVARAADYLAGHPGEVAVLLSVELCTLTLQRGDLSLANLIASGLFGDGAAAVVLTGAGRRPPGAGPAVVATRSSFYPGTEEVMGWQVGAGGFRVVLSAAVPEMVRRFLRRDVDAFLADQGLDASDITAWIAHPGGPRVLEAMQEVLALPPEALAITWRSLREIGNLSSASVLMVLEETMRLSAPPAGGYGLMLAMGPGFCSELVLLRW